MGRILFAMMLMGTAPALAQKFPGGRTSGGSGSSSTVTMVDVVFDSPMINNDSCLPLAVTVPGAVANDFVGVNARFDLGEDIYIGGVRPAGANLVGLLLCNPSTSVTGDPPSGTYRFRLEH